MGVRGRKGGRRRGGWYGVVVAAEVDEDEVFSWCLAALEPGEEVGAGKGGGRGEGGGEGGVPGRGGVGHCGRGRGLRCADMGKEA
jgi:hypothetical protein